MISFEESMKILNSLSFKEVGVQKLFLTDTLDRVLAEDIVATSNSPEYETAAMDGYAIRYEDQSKKRIKILGDNPAGSEKKVKIKEGKCIKTFTGSLMPEGADTLIPIENVEVNDNEIIIKEPVDKGFSVREVGENYKKGEILIKKGSQISFAEIGVMASLNIVMPKVFQKPKVAILATGSEVLEIGQERENRAQIRSSNNYTLEALVKMHGGEVIELGAVKDDKKSIIQAMKEALQSADIVVTTGGVSVGDYDFVKDVVKDEIGADVAFKGVVIKPGQHIMVAKKENKAIIALPGFAYSSTVTFMLYALPVLYKMKGSVYKPKIVKATLKENFVKRSKKTEFTVCNIYLEDGEYFADFKGKKVGSSAILTNMLGDVGLIITSPEEKNKEIGEKVDVWLIK
ncbi:molybdopterin molybdotransferase MoeA [Nitrosophilus kaiyonis]|uniref:molybdopterin molybdotransferase MoeA n=1 Tax=Nitrosophilus kaiyonis TaxID=2930200 RepID=UPI00248FD19E|nr:molybdopterin molybdotransferase MoeA [Nitrosophilus kaiyonis]